MCMYCGEDKKHLDNCPYGEGPQKTEHKCAICGEPICVGELYIQLSDKMYHEDCALDNLAPCEILKIIGIEAKRG